MKQSYDFGKPDQIAKDVAYLYQSIYEGSKKVDQDLDGDADFADVMIARMVASGVPKAEAIRRVRNKSYNEDYEMYEETEPEKRKRLEHERNERRARIAELTASGRVMTSSKRASAKAKERAADKKAEQLERAAQRVINTTRGTSGRVSERPMGSEPPAPKAPVPEANRRLPTGLRKDTLAKAADLALKDIKAGRKSPLESAADEILKNIRKEDYELYELVIEHLLDEGFVDDYESANVMIENMSDEWIDSIIESKKWIQGAIKKPGALHKALDVPMSKKISAKKLSAAAKKGGKMGKRARLAQTLRKFH